MARCRNTVPAKQAEQRCLRGLTLATRQSHRKVCVCVLDTDRSREWDVLQEEKRMKAKQ